MISFDKNKMLLIEVLLNLLTKLSYFLELIYI